MASKHMKVCSSPSVIRETQTETTMRRRGRENEKVWQCRGLSAARGVGRVDAYHGWLMKLHSHLGNCLRLVASHLPTHSRRNKGSVVYWKDGIPHSNRKEWASALTWINLTGLVWSRRVTNETARPVWFHEYEIPQQHCWRWRESEEVWPWWGPAWEGLLGGLGGWECPLSWSGRWLHSEHICRLVSSRTNTNSTWHARYRIYIQ